MAGPPEAVLFMGIPASGKTTFYVRHYLMSHIHISLDVVRSRHREWRLVRTCLDIGQAFVVDNTNPARGDRERYIPAARHAGFRVVGLYFRSRVAECAERNRERPTAVPDAAVRDARRRLERPARDEGFDTLWHVRPDGAGGFEVTAWRGGGSPVARPVE